MLAFLYVNNDRYLIHGLATNASRLSDRFEELRFRIADKAILTRSVEEIPSFRFCGFIRGSIRSGTQK